MKQSKFCGQCGSENPLTNNFCHNCGSKILTDSDIGDQKLIPDEVEEAKYLNLKTKLLELIELSGYFVVSQDDKFVQFLKDENSYEIQIDLGRRSNLSEVQLKQLEKLGFDINAASVNKLVVFTYVDKAVDDILHDTKFIFENIFKVSKAGDFSYDEYFDNKEKPITVSKKSSKKENSKTVEKESAKDKKGGGACGLIFFGAIILFAIISTISNKSDGVNRNEESTTVSSASTKKYGRLVGIWKNEYDAKIYNINVGFKFVLDNSNKLFVGNCDIADEDLQVGAVSEIKSLMREIKFDGKMYVDQDNLEEKYLIMKNGSLQIFDNYGLIDTYPLVFFDPIIKY